MALQNSFSTYLLLKPFAHRQGSGISHGTPYGISKSNLNMSYDGMDVSWVQCIGLIVPKSFAFRQNPPHNTSDSAHNMFMYLRKAKLPSTSTPLVQHCYLGGVTGGLKRVAVQADAVQSVLPMLGSGGFEVRYDRDAVAVVANDFVRYIIYPFEGRIHTEEEVAVPGFLPNTLLLQTSTCQIACYRWM